jgi:formamidopyrimidine-DNA glycosylase
MPELPEVETVVRKLRENLLGRVIVGISAKETAFKLRPSWDRKWGSAIIKRAFSQIRRRGKWILLDFAEGGMLIGHLGMSGRLSIMSDSTDRDKHCHLEFRLSGRAESLRFSDPRRFGGVRFVGNESVMPAGLARLGPEPADLDPTAFHARLIASQRSLKALLLDQSVVAGVGNIYADEALHRAKLAPTQRGCDTTRSQANRLVSAINTVLKEAIKLKGTTFDEVYAYGGFQSELRVYGRTAKPCIACKTAVTCIRLAGRSTHFCPKCQPD